MAEKEKAPKVFEGKIELDVQVVGEHSMFMTQHFGDGSLGDTKFDASFILPSMSLLVKIGGKRYMVSSQDLLTAIINLHEKNGK